MKKQFFKSTLILLLICGFALSVFGCNEAVIREETISSLADSVQTQVSPTGLSEGMVSPPQIMYNGTIYKYGFLGVRNGLPEGFEKIGSVREVNDFEVPQYDLHAAGREIDLKQGQDVYATETDGSPIAIGFDEGYYLFYPDKK